MACRALASSVQILDGRGSRKGGGPPTTVKLCLAKCEVP